MLKSKLNRILSLLIIAVLGASQIACEIYRPEDQFAKLKYDPCELTLTWWGNEERTAAYLEAVDAFMADYPGITVNCEYGSNFSEWTDKIYDDFANSREADVNQINWNWIGELDKDADSLLDLNTVNDVLDLAQFDSRILEKCTNGFGNQSAIPVAVTGRILFWDKTTFDEVGISIPHSFEQLLSAGDKFFAYDADYYPLVLSEYDRMIFMVYYLESLYGKDWVVDGKLAYTEEEIAVGTAMLKTLEDRHVIPTLSEIYKNDKNITLSSDPRWTTGQYGGVFDWDSASSKFSSSLDEGRRFVVGEYFTDIGPYQGGYTKISFCMSISKKTAHPHEAAVLLEYLTNSEAASNIFGSTRGIPVSATALHYAIRNKKLDATTVEANSKVLQWCSNTLDPLFESSELRDGNNGVYYEAMYKLSTDAMTPEQAAMFLYKRISSFYDNNKS